MQLDYLSDSAIPSPGANSVNVMKMSQAFAKQGVVVTLYGKLTTACFDTDDFYRVYDVRPNFTIRRFPATKFRGSGRLYNLRLPYTIATARGDLQYCRSLPAAYFNCLLRRPTVFELHEPFDSKGVQLDYMFRQLVRSPHCRFVVISAALRDYLIEHHGVGEQDILVAHDAADPIARPSTVFTDPQGRFSVGYVGSLYPGKGMNRIAQLAERLPDVAFHIVGGTPDQQTHWQRETAGSRNLTFHGFKQQPELPYYLHGFDVLIAPYEAEVYVSEKRGANNLAKWMSPLKLFEYMSAGKPIVTTRLRVIEEVVEDGKTGLLCTAGAIDEYRRAIERLRDRPTERQRIGAQAHELFAARYTWDKRATSVLNFVRSGLPKESSTHLPK